MTEANAPTPAPQPAPKPAASAPAPKPAAPMTRGDFLWLGWSMLAAFFGASAAATARFFFPNVIYEPAQKFNAGPAKSYDVGVSTKWLSEQRVWIIRNEKGIYALWARCTHLGCTPNWWETRTASSARATARTTRSRETSSRARRRAPCGARRWSSPPR